MNFKRFVPSSTRVLLNPEEKAEILDETTWGNEFEWADVEYMARYFDVYDFLPKSTLLKEGFKMSPYMGLIVSGRIMITKEDTDGNQKVLAHIPKGKTFGEMSLIDGFPSSATVITETNVKLMVLDKESFHLLLDDNPTISNKFLYKLLNLLSARLRETSGKLVDFLDKEEAHYKY